MAKEYSLYEAKAKLSALVRQVREGATIVITVHGEPVAELRPIETPTRKKSLEERIAELEMRGEIAPPAPRPQGSRRFFIGEKKPRALSRFLAERD